MKKYILILIFITIIGCAFAFAQEKKEQITNTVGYHELQAIMTDIMRLSRPSDIPQRIELLNRALNKVNQHEFPEVWAWFVHYLAIAYDDRILGDRAENQELAIDHYRIALEVSTHHKKHVN